MVKSWTWDQTGKYCIWWKSCHTCQYKYQQYNNEANTSFDKDEHRSQSEELNKKIIIDQFIEREMIVGPGGNENMTKAVAYFQHW